jgi:hypothetical protein
MKKVATLLFCFIIAYTYGQNETSADMKKIQIGTNFSTDACYRTPNSLGSISKPKFGYTTGLGLIYNLNKTVGFEIGLQFSDKGYQTEPCTYLIMDNVNIFPSTRQYIHSTYYIDIPFKTNFTFGKKNIRFITSAGFAANFFIAENINVMDTYADGSKKLISQSTNHDNKNINLSPMVSFGIDWKITDKMNLKVEPTFKYGIINIIDNANHNYLWNYGVNVGFYYSM